MKKSPVESSAAQPEALTKALSAELHDKPGSQPTSPPENEFDDRIAQMIDQAVERRFQSAKDRRWNQLERQYGMLSELVAQTPSQAQGDDLPPDQTTAESQPSPTYEKLLSDLAAVVLKQTEQQGEAVLRPAPDPGALSQPLGGAPENDLQSAYETLKRQLRPGDVQGLTALKREFREKGLQIF